MRLCLRILGLGLLIAGVCSPLQASDKKPETCGDFGTTVHFEKNAKDAAKKALKEEKLVLVFHISGHFEEPDYT
jgi:hypothetical protein